MIETTVTIGMKEYEELQTIKKAFEEKKELIRLEKSYISWGVETVKGRVLYEGNNKPIEQIIEFYKEIIQSKDEAIKQLEAEIAKFKEKKRFKLWQGILQGVVNG